MLTALHPGPDTRSPGVLAHWRGFPARGAFRITAISLCLLTGAAVQAQIFGLNLIQNGDAESGPGSLDGTIVGAIPGWSVFGNLTVLQYGASDASGPYPGPTDPGPADRGLNFFAGGPLNASSRAEQTIDLSGYALTIDAGTADYRLSGFFGGWMSQNDHAVLGATFRNGSGEVLGTASVGGVLAADRGDAIALLYRETEARVPIGTRDVLVSLASTRTLGSYNDGFADNLNFAVVPEPGWWGAATGLALIGWVGVIRRRRGGGEGGHRLGA